MIDHHDADLTGSRFRNVNLSRSEFRGVVFSDVAITGAWMQDVRIEGRVATLSVNGVDVTAFVEAELDRRHPERLRLQPDDADGVRQAWNEAVARAEEVLARARQLPANMLDERVNGEFSFLQTVRHLVFAADRWLTGPVFGDPPPYFHPLGQPHDGALEGPADGIESGARPSLDEVVVMRRDHQQRVEGYLRTITDPELRRVVASPNGGETTVLLCLHVVLFEEWWHHQYATRDLAILEARQH